MASLSRLLLSRPAGLARYAAIASLGLMLGGCEAAVGTNAMLFAASTATIINEDKLPTDILASAVTGMDCDTIRKTRDKGPLCRPPSEQVIEPPTYCYRTLGTVSCFDRPNPYGYEQRTIN